MSRCTLVLGFVLLSLVACGERHRDFLSTLSGRCAGTWVVAPEHALQVTAFQPPRDRLVIEFCELHPLGEALVPGKSYGRGTVTIGDASNDCALEFRTRAAGGAGIYLRYVSSSTAPFGLGGDSGGFFLDLMTDGNARLDWLLVDFRRDGEAKPGDEAWVRYTREPQEP